MALYELRDRQREDLHPYLKDILRRNGIEIATLQKEKDGSYTLKVKGHDSPLLEYKDISQSQINALSDGGTNFTNKKAYETFASIVAADFEIPKDYNSAQNALSRINLGGNNLPAAVHFISGARVASFWRPLTPLYDRVGHPHIPKEGRFAHGYHFIERSPHVSIPYLRNEKLLPGEISPNSFGFYYKASSITPKAQNQQEVLDELKNLTLQKAKDYSGAPIPYKDLISSNVYFSSEKFGEVLASHGIIIDKESKTMIIHASGAPTDFSYDLSEEDVSSLLSNDVKEHPLKMRLELINSIIKDDYKGEITLDDLNSNSLVNLSIRPEVLEELKAQEKKNETYINSSILSSGQKNTFIPEGTAIINGKDLSSLDGSKGWYREGKHGREVEVGNIRVERILVPLLATKEEEKQFSSKIEFLNKKEDLPLISDIRELEDVKERLEGRSLNFKEGDDSQSFNIFNIEKAIDDKGYTLTSDKGEKIEVTFDKLLGIVSGKEVPLEVKDSDGIFDHYALASLKEKNENSPSLELNKAQEKAQSTEVKYRMSAVIDGNVISHELTQKQYDKFMALDDLHRMKMFSQIFSEVDMKSNSSLSEKIGAALTASAAFLIAPTLYAEAHMRSRDPIKEIAARNFMELSTLEGQAIHRGL